MFMNPYISRELARGRQREMLAHADHQRLVRRLHAESGITQSGERPGLLRRCALRTAARLRAVPGI
jgi:hypothetical protein